MKVGEDANVPSCVDVMSIELLAVIDEVTAEQQSAMRSVPRRSERMSFLL